MIHRKGLAGQMNHQPAQAIFEEIRERPYAWATAPATPANNCYFKGVELLQRLGVLGYAVRGRVGETYLDKIVPLEVRNLYPPHLPLMHFWVEAQIEENWRVLDASYDSPLASAGFVVNKWDSNRTCFEITRAYTQEESIAYQLEWNDPEYAKNYFVAVAPCATALNRWFEAVRTGG